MYVKNEKNEKKRKKAKVFQYIFFKSKILLNAYGQVVKYSKMN